MGADAKFWYWWLLTVIALWITYLSSSGAAAIVTAIFAVFMIVNYVEGLPNE